ncbi:lymphotoxin-alpha-like [Pelobates fuscus]|uniref:lymphotoxin-alpha-like n=1 Tax=Pelobates fuscus TaxID=191477 RepID=UPI002FE4D3B2
MQHACFRRQFWASIVTLLYLLSLASSSPVQSRASHSKVAKDNKGQRFNMKPAAHFEADPFVRNNLLWTNDTDNGINQGQLSLIDNKVYIPSDGFYYIYTQATFSGHSCPQLMQILLSHVVLLQHDPEDDDKILLSAQKTACVEGATTTSSWRRSIFQGGVFKLKKGNLVYTNTTKEKNLNLEPGQTYFGIYAL